MKTRYRLFRRRLRGGTFYCVDAKTGKRASLSTSNKDEAEQKEFTPHETPVWKKDIALSHPIGELQFLEGIERYQNDRLHQPFPLPPPRLNRDDYCD